MSEAFQIDWERSRRTALPEAILCLNKSTEQIEGIVAAAVERQMPLLLTRLTKQSLELLRPDIRSQMLWSERSQTATLAQPATELVDGVGILTAGTSDLSVAYEAAATLEFLGYKAPIIADVGVAGLWRLLDRLDEIRKFQVLIAIAGMEGALFSVVSGLTEAPVIAVPTSVGYGVSSNGHVALMSALASCSPGVLTVNIDNGFGAAASAVKIMRRK